MSYREDLSDVANLNNELQFCVNIFIYLFIFFWGGLALDSMIVCNMDVYLE